MNHTNLIDLVYERQWSSLGNLVTALQSQKRLGHLYGGFPRYRYENAGIPKEVIRTYPVASLCNFAIRRARLPSFLHLDEPRWIGNWVARQHNLSPIIIANGTAHRFLFPKIKNTGRLLILERGSTHPIDLFEKPQQARKEAGLSYSFKLPFEVIDEIEKTDLADYILAGSQVIKNSYVSRGFPENRIIVASYGVDTSKFLPRSNHESQFGPIKIGIVGIVGFRKGVCRALRIGEWAASRGIDIEIHFVGPVIDTECLPLIHNSNAKVVMHGVLKGIYLLNFLQSCDAICLPSYEDGFGISVIEGMGAGLPAIVSQESGCSEAIQNGRNGIVLTDFDNHEFERLLSGPLQDRKHLEMMGKEARETVIKNYKSEDSVARINNALCKILAI